MTWQPTRSDDELVNKFVTLAAPADVADLLEIKYKRFNYLLFRENRTTNYRHFSIKKKRGGYRPISVPNPELKLLQRKLNYVLQLIYKPKPSAHGFIHERSIVTNSNIHVGKRYVLNIDLQNFFPSINFGRVRGMFMGIPHRFPADVATVLAQLCCNNNELPQGAPTSPIISNMICAQLDSQLSKFAHQNRCDYTRYADDITFSTQVATFPRPIAALVHSQNGLTAEIGDELRTLIRNNGFEINTQKVRVQTRTKRQEVTGLTVNECPNVNRGYVRQVRAMLHAWEKYGLEKAQEVHHTLYLTKHRHPRQPLPKYHKIVEGKINFLRMVKGEGDQIYRKFANDYRALLGKEPKYVVGENAAIFASLWILESPGSCKQGTGFFLKDVGLITCAHVVEADTYAFQHGDTMRTYPVTVHAKNDVVDLAILKIEREVRHFLESDAISEIQQRDRITLVGFPNYQNGDSPHLSEGHVSGFRMKAGIRRMRIDTPIIAGLSGGPVLKAGKVIGVAVTGADRMEEANNTEDHGVIPISALEHLANTGST